MRKCHWCAEDNLDNATTCTHCGHVLQHGARGELFNVSLNTWTLVSLLIMAAILVALFAYARG